MYLVIGRKTVVEIASVFRVDDSKVCYKQTSA